VAALFVAQEALIFPRHMVRPAPDPLPAGAERLELTTGEGHRLVGNLVRARPTPGRGLLIGFAGNAWNADDFTLFLARRLPDLDVAAFHYRGYAPSEGRPGEAALRTDALAVHDHLAARLRPARVLAAGFSLGSGVAAALARERSVDGLLLVTPFDSIESVARARYPWVPVGTLLRHRFRSDLHLAGLETPAAVIAAGEDRIVPARHTEALVRVLRRPVLVETVPGATHGGLYHTPEIDGALRRAVEALLAAAEDAAAGVARAGGPKQNQRAR
jgi:pimeloyl-ACP methyl ester carboxylesterase